MRLRYPDAQDSRTLGPLTRLRNRHHDRRTPEPHRSLAEPGRARLCGVEAHADQV